MEFFGSLGRCRPPSKRNRQLSQQPLPMPPAPTARCSQRQAARMLGLLLPFYVWPGPAYDELVGHEPSLVGGGAPRSGPATARRSDGSRSRGPLAAPARR
jgi:hypothetical protein